MSEYKAGFVGLVGMPNAGKSSLLNKVLAEKLAIVTSRAQTTRRRWHGLYSDERGQAVFVDSPGFVEADKGLNRFLQDEASDVIDKSDVLVAVIGLDEKKPETVDRILQTISASGKPWLGVATKADIKEFSRRIPILRMKFEEYGVPFFLSDASGDQPEDGSGKGTGFLDTIFSSLPKSEGPLFDEQQVSTHSIREFCEEFIREACFLHLRDEVPYGVAVQIVLYDESKEMPRIHANLLVRKSSHKPIVVGKSASMIKKIGTHARKRIEDFLHEKIFLDLNVVVRLDWDENKKLMKELGYVSV